MRTQTYLLISIAAIISGIIFFAFMQEILIIRYPITATSQTNAHTVKKIVSLTFWHDKKWKTEKQELLWHNDHGTNIHHLINNWLTFLDEEHAIEKKVSVQSVLLPISQHEAYLSFDRNPFSKEATTLEKWLFIEGILKTIRENSIPVQQIQFLVHHKPLQDTHLEFSAAWPTTGFFELLQ